jgi:glycosyltransferase involved in cell wall biosynthesis
MKILQVTSARYYGGGERHVVDLVRGLRANGHELYVGIAPDAAIRDELKFLPADNIAEFPLRGAIDYLSARTIASFATARNIDVIHAHVARDYTVAAMVSSRTGIPFVITRHVLFPMSRLHKIFLRNVRFVIAPSNAVASSLREQAIFPEDKIVTVRHGLDSSHRSRRTPIEGGELVVGSIGNLDPVKGFDVLIKAAKDVVDHFPHARFVIAGESRSKSRRTEHALHGLVSDLGLEDRVTFSGWSEDVKETIAGFDIFVSASRSESFGYAIADAMLLGVAVVATETEGAKEIITNASVGTLVPIDSAEALARSIVDLLSDPGRRVAIGEAARSHVAETFSIERMVEETESVYQRVVTGG